MAVGAVLTAGACGSGGEGQLDRPPASTAAPATTSLPGVPGGPGTSVPPAGAPDASALVLAPDGLGVVRFGDDGASVLSRLSELLGPPVDDRPLGSCPSGAADRLVQFAELAVLLDGDAGQQRFVAWDLGPASGTLPALTTAEGVTVGSTLSELRAAYGSRLDLVADDPFGPRFTVPASPPAALGGTLTGTSPGDTVATLQGGSASC